MLISIVGQTPRPSCHVPSPRYSGKRAREWGRQASQRTPPRHVPRRLTGGRRRAPAGERVSERDAKVLIVLGDVARPPWEIGRAQKAFVEVADRVVGSVLDAGCGTGENALFFAARGHSVTGIDFLDEPIRRTHLKASQRGLPAEFLVKDATTLSDWKKRFASVIDCGLFHVFSDADRQLYVQGLRQVIEPGGRLFLMCFSDEEPGTEGPRRVSRQELSDAFADGWDVEFIQPCRFEVNPEFTDITFSAGGPKAWFAVIRRRE